MLAWSSFCLEGGRPSSATCTGTACLLLVGKLVIGCTVVRAGALPGCCCSSPPVGHAAWLAGALPAPTCITASVSAPVFVAWLQGEPGGAVVLGGAAGAAAGAEAPVPALHHRQRQVRALPCLAAPGLQWRAGCDGEARWQPQPWLHCGSAWNALQLKCARAHFSAWGDSCMLFPAVLPRRAPVGGLEKLPILIQRAGPDTNRELPCSTGVVGARGLLPYRGMHGEPVEAARHDSPSCNFWRAAVLLLL